MAITEKDFLVIKKDGTTYMLLKGPTHFHLVQSDGMSENRKNRLFRLYPCGNDILKEMGLHFSAFRSGSLRRVVLMGFKKGDPIHFWVGSSPQEYVLGKDYSEVELNGFFCDHQRTWRMEPKWEGLDPKLIRKVTFWDNTLSIVFAVLFFVFGKPYRLMSVICIVCQIVPIVMVSVHPDSFTLLEMTKKNQNRWQQRGCLLPALVSPGFALALRTLSDFTYQGNEGFWQLLTAAAVLWTVMAVVLIFKAKQLRQDIGEFVALLFMLLFLNLGMAGQLNFLLDFNEPKSYTLEVVDKHSLSGSKFNSYYCTVILPDGQKLDLDVSGRDYRDTEIGENVQVKSWNGAFGINFFIMEKLLG